MFFDKEVRSQLSACLPRGFRPVSVLGQGGCAIVVCVQPRGFSHEVAMKIAWKGSEEQIQNERKTLRSLRGISGVLKLIEWGEDSASCFVCEVVEGQTMEAYFKRGIVTLERALRLIARLADIVGDIHARGIVHRDLKPENVLVRWGKESAPVVIDFGLAMPFGQPHLLPDHVSGTLAFMAPEAFNVRHPPGPAQDLYALGILLYQVCTGVLPFKGENMMELCAQHHLTTVPALPSIYPTRLNALVELCLRKDDRRRLSDAKAFGRTVREAIEELGSLRSTLIPRTDITRSKGSYVKTWAEGEKAQ